MFAFIDWYIKLLTAILGWGSFLFIGLTGLALLLEQKRKVNSLRYNHEVFTLSFSHLTPEMITDLNKRIAEILKTNV